MLKTAGQTAGQEYKKKEGGWRGEAECFWIVENQLWSFFFFLIKNLKMMLGKERGIFNRLLHHQKIPNMSNNCDNVINL